MKYRDLALNAFAKLGEKNQAQLMEYYDKLSERYGEVQAIDFIHDAFLKLKAAAPELATASYKNLLSETAQKLWEALDGQKIAANPKSAIERYREAVKKAKEQEGQELEVEIGGKLKVGFIETLEHLRGNGVLERRKVYKAVASEKKGFEIEVRI